MHIFFTLTVDLFSLTPEKNILVRNLLLLRRPNQEMQNGLFTYMLSIYSEIRCIGKKQTWGLLVSWQAQTTTSTSLTLSVCHLGYFFFKGDSLLLHWSQFPLARHKHHTQLPGDFSETVIWNCLRCYQHIMILINFLKWRVEFLGCSSFLMWKHGFQSMAGASHLTFPCIQFPSSLCRESL